MGHFRERKSKEKKQFLTAYYTGYIYLKVKGYNTNYGSFTLAYNHSSCASNSTTPNANFYASNTQLVSGQSTTLYAASPCVGCTYTWQIFYNGNLINTIQTQNTSRQFTFDYPGTYGVRLTASNGCSFGVASLNGYINVTGYTSNSNNSNPPQQQETLPL